VAERDGRDVPDVRDGFDGRGAAGGRDTAFECDTVGKRDGRDECDCAGESKGWPNCCEPADESEDRPENDALVPSHSSGFLSLRSEKIVM
jgi:hypothetical protein